MLNIFYCDFKKEKSIIYLVKAVKCNHSNAMFSAMLNTMLNPTTVQA